MHRGALMLAAMRCLMMLSAVLLLASGARAATLQEAYAMAIGSAVALILKGQCRAEDKTGCSEPGAGEQAPPEAEATAPERQDRPGQENPSGAEAE